MLRLIKPSIFSQFMVNIECLKQHANLAVDCDIPKENIFVLENGDVLEMSKHGIKQAGRVPAGDVYVDGSRIGDIGSVVIKWP